jgi:hypothetical protein
MQASPLQSAIFAVGAGLAPTVLNILDPITGTEAEKKLLLIFLKFRV